MSCLVPPEVRGTDSLADSPVVVVVFVIAVGVVVFEAVVVAVGIVIP